MNKQRVCVCVCFPYPTVLVFVEKLGRDCRRVPHFAPHFITELPAHRDVDELVLDAFAFKDSYHFCLLRLHLALNKAPQKGQNKGFRILINPNTINRKQTTHLSVFNLQTVTCDTTVSNLLFTDYISKSLAEQNHDSCEADKCFSQCVIKQEADEG